MPKGQADPFILGIPVQPPNFHGRSVELDLISSGARKHRSFLVAGPRRIGKTSLLLTAASQISKDRSVKVAYSDASSVHHPWDIIVDLSRQLGIPLSDPTNISSNRKIFRQHIENNDRELYVLFIDELDRFTGLNNESTELLRFLRYLISISPNCTLVVSALSPTTIEPRNVPWSPLLNMMHVIELGGFSLDETTSFIQDRFAQLGAPYSEQFPAYVFSLTHGFPYQVQWICSLALENFRASKADLVSELPADRLRPQELSQILGYELDRLSLAQQLVLYHISKFDQMVGVATLLSALRSFVRTLPSKLRDEMELDTANVENILRDLTMRGLLERRGDQNLNVHPIVRLYARIRLAPSRILPSMEAGIVTSLSSSRILAGEWVQLDLRIDNVPKIGFQLIDIQFHSASDLRTVHELALPREIASTFLISIEVYNQEVTRDQIEVHLTYDYLGDRRSLSARHVIEFFSGREFKSIVSPFVFGVPIQDSNGFFGREDLVSKILGLLRVKNSGAKRDLALIGRRRIGKTSLMYKLSRDAPAQGFLPVIINLEAIEPRTLEALESRVIDQCLESLSAISTWHWRNRASLWAIKLRRFASSLKPKVSLKGVSVDYVQGAGVRPMERSLRQICQLLARSSNNTPYLLLMFDEASLLSSFQTPGVLSYLRGLIQARDLNSVNFLIVGTDLLHKLTSAESSPLYNLFLTVRVGALSDSESEELITNPVTNDGISFSKESIKLILKYTSRIPYWIQALCHYIVEVLNNRGKLDVQVNDVETAIERLLYHQDLSLMEVWNDLPATDKFILSLISESDSKVKPIFLVHRSEEMGAAIGETAMRDTLGRLVAIGVVASEDDYFGPDDRILSAWVARNKKASDLAKMITGTQVQG